MGNMFAINVSNSQMIKGYLLSIFGVSEEINVHGLFAYLMHIKVLGNRQAIP